MSVLRTQPSSVRSPQNPVGVPARFPLLVAAAAAIKAKGFLIDGDAVVCDESGMAMFNYLN